jgi:glutamate-1-semialdehyde 2,1-aminomutase
MNSVDPTPGYLESLRNFCSSNNILLIFDEVITGFRFARGGAQELFGITPDLSCFGKGIANGFPISVVAGRKEIMEGFKEVFFSGTFGGELLSLTAANVVLDKVRENRVIPELYRVGRVIQEGLQKEITNNRYEFVNISGNSTWTFLNWTLKTNALQNQVKTYFLQEMFRRRILVLNTNNVTTTLSQKAISKVITAYAEVFEAISKALEGDRLEVLLECQPIVPLFKVR